MDLTTTYLGLALPHPIVPGASPLADNIDMVRRLEDAGAAAIVLRSLFEEQLTRRPVLAATLDYFPRPDDFALTPAQYVEHVARVKAVVAVPVIASINATSAGGGLSHARLIEDAGADAIELNFYHLATDPREDAVAVETRLLEIVGAVTQEVSIPVAVKLLPFFSSISHLAQGLGAAGAHGLILFNQLYQPDIDPEMLGAPPTLQWSTSLDLLLRLRWVAILYGRFEGSLAVSGGVHTGTDVVKAVLSGADAVQVVAALIEQGPRHIEVLRRELARWLERHDYESLRQAQGSMSLLRCPSPEAFERGSYMRALQTWRPGGPRD